MMPILSEIPTGYMRDGKGHLVPVASVKPLDMLRHDLVGKLIMKAQDVSTMIADFKALSMSEIASFMLLSAGEYGVKIGGTKGNLTLYNFDQSEKIEMQVAEFLRFDERLQHAKALIDECIRSWGDGAHPGLMTLIMSAFEVDKAGKISTGKVLGLRRHNIDDPKWKMAMQLISDSIVPVGSKRYVRFYKRHDDTENWSPIPLAIADL